MGGRNQPVMALKLMKPFFAWPDKGTCDSDDTRQARRSAARRSEAYLRYQHLWHICSDSGSPERAETGWLYFEHNIHPNMTKSVARLAMEQGIRVNAVAPGPVWTPLIPSTMPLEKVDKFGDNTVFKRPAHPVELASCSSFWRARMQAMLAAKSSVQRVEGRRIRAW